MNPMNVAVLLAALVASAQSEGFHNGPVTFGSDLAHPDGAKSYATITLGASGALNGNAVQRTSERTVTYSQQPQQITIERAAPSVHVVQAPSPQISLIRSAPQVSYVQSAAPQFSLVQSAAPQVSLIRESAPSVSISQSRPQVAVSAGPASHGYTVNAPGLTKTATFGYSSGASVAVNQPRTITVSQTPRYQVQVPQQQIQLVQQRAPQISVYERQAPQFSVYQAPAPQIRIQQAPAPQIRVQQQQQQIVSGPATSHGYTVNAPGLTKTATFGYSSGATTISQPRVTLTQQAPRVQYRVAQPQVQVIQAPAPQIRIQQAPAPQLSFVQAAAPQIRIQQAPAPQIRVQQAPAARIRVEQPRVSVSGPATSHGYTVNAPGLTKTATFGYPSGGVSVSQAAQRVTVQEAPKVQVRVAQPQYQVLQAPAPQIRVQQAPAQRIQLRVAQPQVQYVQAESPQVHYVEAPQQRLSFVQAQAPQVSLVHSQPQVSLLHQTVSPVSTVTYGAPQISVIKTQQPQYQVIPAQAPQISLVRSVQPQVQYIESQPEVKTIQYEAPRVSTSVSGFAAPNVRQQQFNTPSHGYQVSAPGFTKHKTFAGPAVYGTHQDSGISGASGIGHVDFSVRPGSNKSSA